ncbi:MAG: hypothetical protein JSV50_01925, partial [Desulfobacteraceae bacterium]
TIYGKGESYGSESKKRVIHLIPHFAPDTVIEVHFALHDSLGMGPRTIQRLVKRVAHRAGISRPVTPRVLRHTYRKYSGQE